MKKIFIFIGSVIILTACAKSPEQQVAEQLELGQRYLLEGKYEEAVIAFQKVIEIDERNVEAYFGLGEVYEEQAKFLSTDNQKAIQYYEQAVEVYEKVQELDSNNSQLGQHLMSVWLELGQCYFIEGDNEKVVIVFQKIMELDEVSIEAYLEMGEAYENLAKGLLVSNREKAFQYYKLATDVYEKILEKDSDNSEACEHLITIYKELGDSDKLQKLLSQYQGEAKGETLKRELEIWRTCIGIICQISDLCAVGGIDGVFLLMQSDEYQQFQEKVIELGNLIFDMGSGIGLGVYPVSTKKYGNCMIYYGDYKESLREGNGMEI